MKSVVRVMVALVAFLVGVSSSQFWSLRQRKIIQIASVAKLKVVDQPAISPPSETWRRIVVKGRFSFYIPPYLSDDGHSTSGRMAVGAFRKGNYDMRGLFHLYYYSHNETENDPNEASNRYKSTIRSEVTIGGKRARMVTEIPAADEIMCIHDLPGVWVYFPDIGGGRKLYMSFASGDEQGIEVAKRVIDSIEFLRANAPNTRLEQTRR